MCTTRPSTRTQPSTMYCSASRREQGTWAATRFDRVNNNITDAALGVATSEERGLLIDWLVGTDNADDERGPGGNVTVRPSVHGDVLHSRPAVINYGDSRGTAVFYGANDGRNASTGEYDLDRDNDGVACEKR